MPLRTNNPAWTSQLLCQFHTELEHARDALRDGDDDYAHLSAAMDALAEADAALERAGWDSDHCVRRAA